MVNSVKEVLIKVDIRTTFDNNVKILNTFDVKFLQDTFGQNN